MEPFLEQYQAQAARLRAKIPLVHGALGGPGALDDLPGWRELCNRPDRVLEVDGKPVLVATLFGPTGAGKSTLFNHLTGACVPAGGAVRPMTHHTAVAVPRACLAAGLPLPQLFPGYAETRRLERPADLQDAQAPDDPLYVLPYDPPRPAAAAWSVLADCPDFNSVVLRNWTRAEHMLARAEVVVFLVYPESYKDERTMTILRQCCRLAGYLAYVFTKADPAEARLMWADLVAYARQAADFQEARQDGRSLAEFLAAAPVYFAPRVSQAADLRVAGLDAGTPDLFDLLAGLPGVRILLASLLEAAADGLRACRGLCAQAARQEAALAAQLDRLRRDTDEAAGWVAGSYFPVGRFLELLIRIARQARPAWVRWMTWPLSLTAQAGLKVWRGLRQAVLAVRTGRYRAEVADEQALERRRLDQAAEQLADQWRRRWPDAAPDEAACRQALDRLRAADMPAPDLAWEQAVEADARRWVREHPWRTSLLGSLNDLLIALGGLTAAVDLLVTGGSLVLGPLGILGAAGGGCALAGLLLKVFEELGLSSVLKEADQAWRQQRSRQLAGLLRARLADPLAGARWEQQWQALRAAPVAECAAACNALEQLVQEVNHDAAGA